MTVDVLIAGGGPAGLATAIRCAQAGLSVTVVDPRVLPVDKACGEGLMPSAVQRLATLGVFPAGHPIRGIRYLDATHRADAPFRRGEGLGVRRTQLHAALSARAAALGVTVTRGVVEDASQDDAGVTALTKLRDAPGADRARLGREVRARYLVAADGLHSPLRRRLGLDAGVPPQIAAAGRAAPAERQHARPMRRDSRYGLRRHYRVAPWTDLVEVYWAAGSEAYVTPVAADTVGVAVLGGILPRGGADGGYDARLATFPALHERLREASPVTRVLGAGPLRQETRRRVAGRVLLVGDAAGYVDALTGEGIGAALAQAEVLVECLTADRPGDYERAWQRVTRKGWALTSGLLWSRHQSLLGSRIAPAAQRFPWLFTLIVNQAAWA
ncbi:MAG: NAD(P)/FAD-dependent oxidoreductase [Actinomycetia bacterium]|nr:NAD(P)/FAD-dependent oxidoreductase [Actinomycetes bacterium]